MVSRVQTAITVAAVCLAIISFSRNTLADSPSELPTSCSSGDVVAYDGGGRFKCVAVRELLHLDGCSSGEFVVAGSGGRLECRAPSSTPWGIKGLLPDCSSGSTLVSEGFGAWKCVAPPR